LAQFLAYAEIAGWSAAESGKVGVKVSFIGVLSGPAKCSVRIKSKNNQPVTRVRQFATFKA